MTDYLGGSCSAAGLRILDVTCERVDNVSRQTRAIRRSQRGSFLSFEVVFKDQFAAVLGKD